MRRSGGPWEDPFFLRFVNSSHNMAFALVMVESGPPSVRRISLSIGRFPAVLFFTLPVATADSWFPCASIKSRSTFVQQVGLPMSWL